MENLYTIIFLITILCLFTFWIFGIKPYFLARHRQILFELRDELFDYASLGKIQFNSPAYKEVRNNLNARIRFTHRLNLIDYLLMKYVYKSDKLVFEVKQQLADKINSIQDEEVRRYLLDIQLRADMTAAAYFIKSSPLSWLYVAFLIVGFVIKDFIHNAKISWNNIKKPSLNKIEQKYDPLWYYPITENKSLKIKPI